MRISWPDRSFIPMIQYYCSAEMNGASFRWCDHYKQDGAGSARERDEPDESPLTQARHLRFLTPVCTVLYNISPARPGSASEQARGQAWQLLQFLLLGRGSSIDFWNPLGSIGVS